MGRKPGNKSRTLEERAGVGEKGTSNRRDSEQPNSWTSKGKGNRVVRNRESDMQENRTGERRRGESEGMSATREYHHDNVRRRAVRERGIRKGWGGHDKGKRRAGGE